MIPWNITSTRGGLSNENASGPRGSYKYASGINIHDRDDGFVSVPLMKDANFSGGGDVSTLVRWFVPCSDGSLYAFGATGSIYVRPGDGTNIFNFAYNDENGAIKGASEWKLSDGNRYLMWATDTSVSRVLLNGSKDIPWSTPEINWKTTLDPATWHTMTPASGSLMIANNEYLATIDFDGNFEPGDLNIRPGNLIKSLEERDDFVIIGTEKESGAEEGHIFSWLTTALSWVQKQRIPIAGVNALIYGEFPLLQGGADGEIFLSDFSSNEPVARVPTGGTVNPGGVTIFDDRATFGFYNTSTLDNSTEKPDGIWTYGRKNRERNPAFAYDYKMSVAPSSSISEIGAVTTYENSLFAGYSYTWTDLDGTHTQYRIDFNDSDSYQPMNYESLEFDAGTPSVKKKVESMKFCFVPGNYEDATISAKYKLNKETAWRYMILADGSTTYTFPATVVDELIFTAGGIGRVIEVGFEAQPITAGQWIISATAFIDEIGNEF